MKWAAGIFFLILYLVWPYYTVFELGEAIKSADTATLKEVVDWSSVRTSFKAQMEAELEKKSNGSGDPKDARFAALGKAFALTVVNSFIDKVLTPEGISRLIKVSRAEKTNADDQGADNDFYKRIKFAFFISPIDFRVDLRSAASPSDDRTVTMMLTFKGNSWQVTDIRFPPDLGLKTAQAEPK